MFGMGMGEIVLIAVVALLVLGPERLPGAAKAIGKGIRDLRQQSKALQSTIEADTQIGDAVREIKGALRGDPENLYKQVTGDDWQESDAESISSILASAKAASESKNDSQSDKDAESDKDGESDKEDESGNNGDSDKRGDSDNEGGIELTKNKTALDSGNSAADPKTSENAAKRASSNVVSDLIDNEFANTDDRWGEAATNPHVVSSDSDAMPDNTEDSDMPLIRPAANTIARQEALDDDNEARDAHEESDDARNDSDNV